MARSLAKDVEGIVAPTPRKPGNSSLNDMPLTPPQSPPPNERSLEPADLHIPDNYVQHTLATVPPLPPIQFKNILKEMQWISVMAITVTPAIAIWGAYTTTLRWQTGVFAVLWYFVTGLGITAGYHRLWAHRSYNASKPLEYFLAFAGAGSVQGSIKWWSRGHRAHHRYTDTDLDPYGAHHGLLWSHVGWMVFKPRRRPGVADVSDLAKNPVVQFQHRWYVEILLFMAFIAPTLVAGFGWGDFKGGFIYAGAARLVFVHHSTFCVNSLAHWLGDTPFDDKNTPRDHVITAFVTIGEGYHNFHHEFPMDYRNAIKWYQYDPTKWFIATCSLFGLASHLKVFPDNEVKKGQLTMKLKKLRRDQDALSWPTDVKDMPVITWDAFQEESKERPLILVAGFIHDVSSFLDEHPGGRHLLSKNIGRDATTAFHGGVYDHSNAAHNLLAMMRVGVLSGGLETESEKAIPPSQKLRILRVSEIKGIAQATSAAAVRNASADESAKGVDLTTEIASAVHGAGYLSSAAS